MPSFDTVSEVDAHELTNAVDQANRELGKRFDFRGSRAACELDVRCLDPGEPESNVSGARQSVAVKQGIEQAIAKKIGAALKASGLKVDTQIQGEKLRVSGKKRDDLQSAIALLRKSDFELPLQFENFRD